MKPNQIIIEIVTCMLVQRNQFGYHNSSFRFKMCNKKVLIFLIIYLGSFVNCENNNKKNVNKEDAFVPTHEWQVIKEGQTIPKGLHVRINFETGLKEAKLLDSADSTEQSMSTQPEGSNALLEIKQPTEEDKPETETNSNSYSHEELAKILQNIKSDENLPTIDTDDINRVKEKFRDYKQLKKELGDLNMTVKTDAEILRDLFNKFKDVNSNKDIDYDGRNMMILDILEEFEYLVHQIDNANEFIKMNGITEIIYTSLNSSTPKVKSEALNILGSCVQNNAKAQISALESGAIDKVLRLLATESNKNVKLRTVYALGSLLRRFPLAQKHFISNGGLDIFTKILSKPEELKLQLKIITLLYDLLVEQKDTIEHDSVNKEKLRQYAAINFKNTLIKNGWCSILNDLLIRVGNIIPVDHDAIEKCLLTIKFLVSDCTSTFKNTKLLVTLNELNTKYEQLNMVEFKDEQSSLFNDLYFLTRSIYSAITATKDEL